MKKPKRSFWATIMLAAMAILTTLGGVTFARGGGGGRGGFGGGRGGRGGISPAAARGGRGQGQRNNQRKEEQERQRREERIKRVAEARIVYAKRERQNTWDKENQDRFRNVLDRVFGGSTE